MIPHNSTYLLKAWTYYYDTGENDDIKCGKANNPTLTSNISLQLINGSPSSKDDHQGGSPGVVSGGRVHYTLRLGVEG